MLSVSLAIDFLPTMPPTYTITKILLEFCILSKRPNSSKHSLWDILIIDIFYSRFRLVSVSVAIGGGPALPSHPLPSTTAAEYSPAGGSGGIGGGPALPSNQLLSTTAPEYSLSGAVTAATIGIGATDPAAAVANGSCGEVCTK